MVYAFLNTPYVNTGSHIARAFFTRGLLYQDIFTVKQKVDSLGSMQFQFNDNLSNLPVAFRYSIEGNTELLVSNIWAIVKLIHDIILS